MLGNIEFGGEEKVVIQNKDTLRQMCRLFQVKDHVMEESLTCRFFGGGGRNSTYTIPMDKNAAIENRDALSKVN